MSTNTYYTNATRIAVVGGGSWATALIKILCENNVAINWWLRSQSDIDHIVKFGRNPSYLSGVAIDLKKVTPYNDMRDALSGVDIIVLAVPAAFIPDALKKAKEEDFKDKIVVSTIKGMIPNENILVTQYVEKKFRVPEDHFLIVAGPCHAEEIALEKQSYLTIGGNRIDKAQQFANLVKSRFVKSSVITDVQGAEYCAIMKNIIAIACGIARGLNQGDNFQAVLVSNAMQEIKRFIDVIQPLNRDLNASAYLGDLLVTTYSQFSRNRTFGNMIGQGYSVKSAQMEMNMVAEGYYAVKSIYEVNKRYKVNMPITKAVYHILYEKISPLVEFQILKDVLK